MNPAAEDFVIKGRFDLQQATTAAVQRAESEFQRAIDTDPGYAVAYLELANAKLAEASALGSTFPPSSNAIVRKSCQTKHFSSIPTWPRPMLFWPISRCNMNGVGAKLSRSFDQR